MSFSNELANSEINRDVINVILTKFTIEMAIIYHEYNLQTISIASRWAVTNSLENDIISSLTKLLRSSLHPCHIPADAFF